MRTIDIFAGLVKSGVRKITPGRELTDDTAQVGHRLLRTQAPGADAQW